MGLSINHVIWSNGQRVGQNVTLGHVNGEWVLGKVMGSHLSQNLSSQGPKTPIDKPESGSKVPTPLPSSQKSNQNSDLFELINIS